jgi:molybdopterin-containing oxidoreductase family iron-sulfur binding subunit
MNTCIGCSACIVSCQAENNIPVVGKDEVIRRREMHWIRIDRYYSSEPEELEEGQTVEEKRAELDDLKWSVAGNKALEKPSDYPTRVTFQPIMCQHCNHATCETVCPVIATSHSSEGLNQMTYNRCIGTRYCANNCAYKVRRFNWFNYSDSRDTGREFMGVNTPMNDDLAKMVLNPDVMVRARGVIEKCSMCVQRIQEGKLSAKLSKKALEDGDINLACSNSCPSDCMTFGDMNDPKSKVSKLLAVEGADRKYHVLEELNVKPNVSYLTKIRNI